MLKRNLIIKTKTYILILLIALLFAVAPQVRADSTMNRECQVKAAFVYNFLKFIDFPDEKPPAPTKAITISLLGSGGCTKALGPIKSKQVKGKNIIIKHFKGLDKLKELQKKNNSKWKENLKELKKCQVLFVCSCADEQQKLPVGLLEVLKDSGILVIG